MAVLFRDNFQHFLAIIILLSRIGDIISTKLVTPTLKLESNSAVKEAGWKLTYFSLIMCIFPYFTIKGSLVILIPSLLVCVSNFSKVALINFVGEDKFHKIAFGFANGSNPKKVIFLSIFAPLFLSLIGVTIYVSDLSYNEYTSSIASGFFLTSIFHFYFTLDYYFRLRREGSNSA